jgi:class 3 adenylate cyclase
MTRRRTHPRDRGGARRRGPPPWPLRAHTNTHPRARAPRRSYNTVCMFADVSGFTKLSEAMTKYGPEGGEHVKKHLNSYFGQMVRIIAGEGGDIFKFAGDAMIVLWPDVDDVQVRRGGTRGVVLVVAVRGWGGC